MAHGLFPQTNAQEFTNNLPDQTSLWGRDQTRQQLLCNALLFCWRLGFGCIDQNVGIKGPGQFG